MTGDTGEDGIIRGVYVAVAAARPLARMSAAEDGEPGVVKGGAQPAGRAVACGAGRGEIRGHMIRTIGAGVILLMAGVAIGRRTGVAASYMATGAGDAHMCPSQRESRPAVVEGSGNPASGRVADETLGRESRSLVVRVGRSVVILHVAGRATGVHIGEVPIGVAGGAGQSSVHAG